MKTYLHVGLHKTGTTFLQYEFFPKLKDIKFLTRPFTQHNIAFNQIQYADESLYEEKKVKEEINRIVDYLKPEKLVVSDESLLGKPLYFSYINRSLIAHRLHGIFPDAAIIIFIRAQKDILVSEYNTYINDWKGFKKAGDLFWKPSTDFTIEKYESNRELYDSQSLYYNTNGQYIHFDGYKYYELIQLYRKLFKRVEIFLFEDLKQRPKETLQRLLNILEEDEDVNKFNFQQKVNHSKNVNSLNAVRLANKYGRGKRTKKIMASLINPLVKKDSQIDHNALEEECRRYYADNNRQIIRNYPEIGLDRYKREYLLE